MIRHRTHPEYGRGTYVLPAGGDDDLDREQVIERLVGVFRSPGYEPPVRPSLAIELLALSRRADADLRDVLVLLEREPLLAAKVLRRAQSPVAGAQVPVRTLLDAVVRLGIRALGDLLFEVTLGAKVFRARGYEAAMDGLRKHSVVVAHLARRICRLTALSDEHAFLCGLLHDVGAAAALIVLAAEQRPPLPADELGVVLRAVHVEAGKRLCALWGLPQEIGLVVQMHHDPWLGNRVHPVAAALQVADAIAETVLATGMEEAGGELEGAARALDLRAEQVTALHEDAAAAAAQVE